MKMSVHLSQKFVKFFLEWDISQKKKIVDISKHPFYVQQLFPKILMWTR